MIGPGTAMRLTLRHHPGPMLTVALAMLASGALALVRGDPRFWAFLIVMSILTAVVSMIDHRAGFTRPLAWMIAVLGVAHLAGGLLPPVEGATFYETWLIPGALKFDQAVHLYGSVVSTIFAWQILNRYLDHERTTATTHAVLAAGFGLGKGALNEVIEFLLAAQFRGIYPGAGTNTEWDLVFNLAGVIAAAMVLRASPRRAPVHATTVVLPA